MTWKQKILAKPDAVQIVLKVFMAHPTLVKDRPLDSHDEVEMEALAEAALTKWDDLVRDIRASARGPRGSRRRYFSECAIADRLVEGLRKQEGWGRILRGAAN